MVDASHRRTLSRWLLAVFLAGLLHSWMHAASVDGLAHFDAAAEAACPAEKLGTAVPFVSSPPPAACALPPLGRLPAVVAVPSPRSGIQPRAPPLV